MTKLDFDAREIAQTILSICGSTPEKSPEVTKALTQGIELWDSATEHLDSNTSNQITREYKPLFVALALILKMQSNQFNNEAERDITMLDTAFTFGYVFGQHPKIDPLSQ